MKFNLSPGFGPSPAEIMVIGDVWRSTQDAQTRRPFQGAGGKELGTLFHQYQLLVSDARCTNVVNAMIKRDKTGLPDITSIVYTSKKKAESAGVHLAHYGKYVAPIVREGVARLAHETFKTQPKIILACGDLALWACTGNWGIGSWRGSMLRISEDSPLGSRNPALVGTKVVPTYHPEYITRMHSWGYLIKRDFQRLVSWKDTVIESGIAARVRPTYENAIEWLDRTLQKCDDSPTPVDLACDIETRGNQIACFGWAWSAHDGACVPIMTTEDPSGNYWTWDEETEIVLRIRKLLRHPNAHLIWQNGAFDLTYIYTCWGFMPQIHDDTMLAQHAAYPGLKKSLEFISSMYCRHYEYWKDESQEWNPKKRNEDVLWTYNVKDCCYTFECMEVLRSVLESLNTTHIYRHSLSLYEPVLFMVLLGCNINRAYRSSIAVHLSKATEELKEWIGYVLNNPNFNIKSTPQMRSLFYDELKVPIQKNRKTGQPSLDDTAMQRISKSHPLLCPLIDRIQMLKSVGVFNSTFVKAPLDPDGRIRCSYHISGTETGRFSSSKNVFGRGTNLENIPRPADDRITPLVSMPNVRQMFVPDPGYVIADFDLDRADAHIVAWESGAEGLKELFKQGVDVHSANAAVIGTTRQVAKGFVHGTNYGGSAKTVAGACGTTVAVAKRAQAIWFNTHPQIQEWHERVEHELMRHRSIRTIFGRYRYYFDKIGYSTVHEALAYLGQSPVADVINKGLRAIYHELPWCHLLLQNHDSVVVQFPSDCLEERVEAIMERLRVPVPYDDPLTIPVGCKLSFSSWGELEEFEKEVA